jgi:hypothetical protein
VAYCKRMKVVEEAELWVVTTLLMSGMESQRLPSAVQLLTSTLVTVDVRGHDAH